MIKHFIYRPYFFKTHKQSYTVLNQALIVRRYEIDDFKLLFGLLLLLLTYYVLLSADGRLGANRQLVDALLVLREVLHFPLVQVH